MCDLCVIERVKQQMLSRRNVLKGAVAGVAATAVGASIGRQAIAASEQVEDMTHELHEEFPTFFGDQQFFVEPRFSFVDNGFNASELRFLEHVGTHVDAPLHFSADGHSVAEIPVANLVVPLCVIDIRARAAADDNAQVTPEDLTDWIAENGDIPDNACVAMNSGWDKHVGSEKFRNVGDDEKMHFPGFHVDTVQMLLEETSTAGIATDTLSLDYGQSADFATHYKWLPENRWGVECIANLDAVPAAGATLVVGAPKHRGGSGGPSRIFALV